ncbi:MAG TPA: methyl-accepting chemotaxis protein [Clostridium sp.]|nr:methyl-accepting chemotaxis protein [Clostridium sp.]
MRSIKQRLVVSTGLLVVGTSIFLNISADRGATRALKTNVESSIVQTANQTGNSLKGMISGKLVQVESVAARSEITDPNVPLEEKVRVLDEEAKRTGCKRFILLDTKGNALNIDSRGTDYTQKDYFKKALAGESNMSDPVILKEGGDVITVCAAPVKVNGEVTGVLLRVGDGTELSDITNNIKYGESGITYVLNKEGRVIAYPDKEVVLGMQNAMEIAKTDSNYKGLAEVTQKVISEKNGFATYEMDKDVQCIAYAPIPGTEWVAVIDAPAKELFHEVTNLRYKNILISIGFAVVGLAITYKLSLNISKGINESSKVLETLAQGDLKVEVSDKYINEKDEIGDMTRAMKSMSESLSTMIKDVKTNSSNIDNEAENLSTAAAEINSVSQNVAHAINEIAKGTSNQSENLLEISETLNKFGNDINQVVNEIRDVDRTSKDINDKANESTDEMALLTKSVTNVSNVFKTFNEKIDGLGKNVTEINEITNVINGIAEQTNLLALNAAIEAARAGESGKGFAIVAEEIRQLAEQSQISAEKITRLIFGISEEANNIVRESSVMDEELSKQEEVIKKSIESFNSIIESIDDVLPKINIVEKSAQNLNSEKDNILSKVKDISSVSSEVSASAEEISASTEEMNASIEEMSGIAESVKEMTKVMLDGIDEFKVN